MTLTGRETAAQTARMASRSGNPGANSTLAPAASNAFSRAIVSSRSSRPWRKFSARAVTTRSTADRAARWEESCVGKECVRTLQSGGVPDDKKQKKQRRKEQY